MRYASVCSGIEAPTMAWHSLGWTPAWFSQFDPEINYVKGLDFGSAVLNHHYPDVPNLGDMTKLHSNEVFNGSKFDLLVGGTPCQSFSVAGLQRGLSDPRGNLALEFVRILDTKRPTWFIWENVPGVLSSSGGRDFASIIGAFVKIGYSVSWRVLDAQYFGVPQKRRRVFVVGHIRDWRCAAAVLHESKGLYGDYQKGQTQGENTSSNLGTSVAFDLRGFGDYGIGRTSSTLKRRDYKDATDLVVSQVPYGYSKSHRPNGNVDVRFTEDGKANCLNTGDGCGNQSTMNIVATFDSTQITSKTNRSTVVDGKPCSTITKDARNLRAIQHNVVRRLTPTECERLQGFPDGFTNIPWKGKPISPDGVRYMALGNSMAVPCMKWIGERIAMVDAMENKEVPLNYALQLL